MPSFYRVRMPNYVTQRANGIYEIRYPIPEDVQRFYPRKDGTGFRKLIIKSLGTRDPKEAKSKEVEFISEFEAKCKVLRGGVDKDHLEEILSRMYAGELHEFELGRIDEGRLTDDSIYGLETKRLNLAIFKGLKGEEAQNATVDAYVRQVLLYLGVAKDPWEIEDTSSLYQTIKPMVLSVLVDIYRAQIARLEGLPEYEPESSFLKNKTHKHHLDKPRKPATSSSALTIGQYFSSYIERLENAPEPIKDRTLNRRKKSMEHFASWVGESTLLSEIGKKEVWEFHDALCDLPCRAYLFPELKNLSFKEQVKRSRDKEKWQVISASTAADLMRHLGQAFVEAEKRGVIETNPASGVTVKIPKGKKRTKRSFSPEELRKIFDHDDFSTVKTPEDADDLFWLPILMLCTGARTSELYLRVDEVNLEAKFPYIEIKENEARELKNLSSERIIPIHPVLLQLGFDRYVEKRKSQGDEWLFPEWVIPKSGTPSDSKRRQRFNTKVLEEIGIKEPALTAHCFRHNYETALAEGGIPDRLAKRLTGRSLKGDVATYTSAYLNADVLYMEVEKLDFTDVLSRMIARSCL